MLGVRLQVSPAGGAAHLLLLLLLGGGWACQHLVQQLVLLLLLDQNSVTNGVDAARVPLLGFWASAAVWLCYVAACVCQCCCLQALRLSTSSCTANLLSTTNASSSRGVCCCCCCGCWLAVKELPILIHTGHGWCYSLVGCSLVVLVVCTVTGVVVACGCAMCVGA